MPFMPRSTADMLVSLRQRWGSLTLAQIPAHAGNGANVASRNAGQTNTEARDARRFERAAKFNTYGQSGTPRSRAA